MKNKAIELRQQGFSYGFIREQVPVSKSTLNRWLDSIPFVPNSDFVNKVNRTHALLNDSRRTVKTRSEGRARIQAVSDVGRLTERDLFMLGLGLYMRDGSKSGGLRVVSADPGIIKTAITWFKKSYGIDNSHFRVRIHLFPQSHVEGCLKYWQEVTGLGKENFYPVYIEKKGIKRVRKGEKLLFGTAHVTILSYKRKEFGVYLRRRIVNSIEIVKNQAGLI